MIVLERFHGEESWKSLGRECLVLEEQSTVCNIFYVNSSSFCEDCLQSYSENAVLGIIEPLLKQDQS